MLQVKDMDFEPGHQVSSLIQELSEELQETQRVLGKLCQWVRKEFGKEGWSDVPVPEDVINYAFEPMSPIPNIFPVSSSSPTQVVQIDEQSQSTPHPKPRKKPRHDIDWNNDGAAQILNALLDLEDRYSAPAPRKVPTASSTVSMTTPKANPPAPDTFPCKLCLLSFPSADQLQRHGMMHCFVPVERLPGSISPVAPGPAEVVDPQTPAPVLKIEDTENTVDLDIDDREMVMAIDDTVPVPLEMLPEEVTSSKSLDKISTAPVTSVPESSTITVLEPPAPAAAKTFYILAPLNKENGTVTIGDTVHSCKEILASTLNAKKLQSSKTKIVPVEPSSKSIQREPYLKGQGFRSDLYSSSGTRVFPERSSPATPKVHTCGTCGKTLASSDGLHRHELIHRGIRPYTCSTCPRSFTQLASLRRHTLQHLAPNQRPKFLCPHCDKKYLRKDFLNTHLKETHGDKLGISNTKRKKSDPLT